MPDDLSSTLEGCRRRHSHGYTSNPRRDYCYADNQDWPCDTARLLAAIEAVLELAGNANPILSGFSDMSVIGFTLDPKAIREAISRELSGTS